MLVLGLAACGGGQQQRSSSSEQQRIRRWGAPSAKLSGEIAGAGSTAQQAAQEAWIAEFENANSGATISYDAVGSGGGREQFIAGGVAYAGTDSPLSEDEGELGKAVKRCAPGELVEIPDYISPIAIIYNLPGVEELQLDPETLAKIFNQEITNWNDPAIAKDNPGVELPGHADHPGQPLRRVGHDRELHRLPLQGGARASGRTKSSGDWPVKGGEAASGTSGVVEAVAAGEGAIGYADASQAGELGIAHDQSRQHLRRTDRRKPRPKILDHSKEDPELAKAP